MADTKNLQPGPEMDKAVCEKLGIQRVDVRHVFPTGNPRDPYHVSGNYVEYPKVSTSLDAFHEHVVPVLKDKSGFTRTVLRIFYKQPASDWFEHWFDAVAAPAHVRCEAVLAIEEK